MKLIGRVRGDLWANTFEVSTKHSKDDGDHFRYIKRNEMDISQG